jgi:predicted dehydrogenase
VDLGQAAALADLAQASGVRHIVGLQGYHAPGALFARELIESGDIGQPLAVSVVAAGGPAGRRIPQANVYATDAAAGATVLSISTGHILATLARAVGEFRGVSAVPGGIHITDWAISLSTPDGSAVDLPVPERFSAPGRITRVASVPTIRSSNPGVTGADPP